MKSTRKAGIAKYDAPLTVFQWAVLAIASISLILIILGTLGVGNFSLDLGGSLATVSAAGIAAVAAMASVRTWAAQRHQAIDEMRQKQREAIYAALIEHHLRYFSGGSPSPEEAVRAQVVTWGGEPVLDAMANWRALVKEMPIGANGAHLISAELRPDVHKAISELVLAIRNDLEIDRGGVAPALETIGAAIFDDAAISRSRDSRDRGSTEGRT